MFDRFKKREGISLRIEITAAVEQDEGGFHAFAPALKGLHVDGATEEEAIQNLMEATVVYLNSLAMHGDPLPVGPDLTVQREKLPEGAHLRNVIVQWSSLQMCGAS